MATTVNQAFDEFLRDTVNLDSVQVSTARNSRKWLRSQLVAFPEKHDDFPLHYPDVDIDFGSFARRTKIRELDDIDLIHGLKAEGATYLESGGGQCTISVPQSSRLYAYRHENSDGLLNSRRILNKFVKHLSEVPQYSAADVNRRQEAAVLKLKSYPWTFDIVPAFFTAPEWDGRTYYLMPDGEGHWKKTDPRLDGPRVSKVNQAHDGHMLNVIRTIKFWNRRPTMPTVPSYLLECMLVDYYEGKSTKALQWVDMEFGPALTHIANSILSSVQDPKRIQGDLNTLPWADRVKVQQRAQQDAVRSEAARQSERSGDHKKSISQWGEIFGSAFPTYTGE